MIDAQRVDFIAVPVRDRERAVQFYGVLFTDSDGNGLIIHRQSAPCADGTRP